MSDTRRVGSLTALLVIVGMASVGVSGLDAAPRSDGLRFEVVVPSDVRAEAVTGRVFVMVTRRSGVEPRLAIGRTGEPFFGVDVVDLEPGTAAVVDAQAVGWPVESVDELPPDDYFVQGFVNLYSRFDRADGHTVWMHQDRWEGQRFEVSPGNLYSDVRRVRLDPGRGGTVRLVADHVIPPVEIPEDTRWVQRFRFESPMLTEFWGRPIHLGATVLLPRGYHDSEISYPVLYRQGHFSLRAPLGFRAGTELYDEWVADGFPRMIVVTFQHPNPYFDDSYAVDSVNVGPYGDAIMRELIPEVERRYRIIGEPWARLLDGGSTGGWEALALQVFHPDSFGGVWSYCPDPVTFTNVEGVNVYEDDNAFFKGRGWFRVPVINTREVNGEVRLTSRQRNRYELAKGTRGRSGEQLDIWAAVFGPLGDDGYFRPLYDKRTGAIDSEVAEHWRQNYDLLEHMKRNWSELGPKLVGKIHVYTGDMDNFYLNEPVYEMDAWMRTTEDPHYEGTFLYGRRKGHCWIGPVTMPERLREMARHVMEHQPAVRDTPWWDY